MADETAPEESLLGQSVSVDGEPEEDSGKEVNETIAGQRLRKEVNRLKTQAVDLYQKSARLRHQAGTLTVQAQRLDQEASDLSLTTEMVHFPKRRIEPDKEATERLLRSLFRDVLSIVTDGRMRLCDTALDLPSALEPSCPEIALTRTEGLSDMRQCVKETSLEIGISDERWQDLLTACHEAGMNAVVHAGSGVGSVSSDGQETVQIRVTDQGHGIEVERLPRATLERGYSTAGTFGHGMKMMLQGVDRVWLLTGPLGTTIVLEQDRIAPEPSWF